MAKKWTFSLPKLDNLFYWFFPLIWLYLPNLALIYFNPAFGLSVATIGLLLTVLCPIPFIVLCSKNLRQFWFWNIPFAAVAGFYAGAIAYYHDIPFIGLWFDVWNTSHEVIAGIIIYYAEYFFIGVCGFIIYCACMFHPVQKKVVFSRRFKTYSIFASLITLALVMNVTNFLSSNLAIQRLINQAILFENYPFGMLGMIAKTMLAFSKRENVPLPVVTRGHIPHGREIYVLVIGEAARNDDWHAISYMLNSKLLKDPNLKTFDNVAAQANLTSIALPLLMSGTSTIKDYFTHSLWMQFAKAANCTTGWITNATEPYNYPYQTDFYDLNLNRNAWVGFSGVVYDSVLLPQIQRTFEQGPEKLCLVVHFIGSHFDYRLRYQADVARFRFNHKAYSNNSSFFHATAFHNAYYNSVIQTNVVLEGIIDMLKKENATSFLLYMSDHAESFNDYGNRQFFHGNLHPYKTEINVPFFIWANERFQREYPKKWQALKANQGRNVSNIQVLPTMLDALAVSNIPAYMAPSLLQPYKNDVKQLVLLPSNTVVDYQSLPPKDFKANIQTQTEIATLRQQNANTTTPLQRQSDYVN